jgi:cytoskeletal protein RodZ
MLKDMLPKVMFIVVIVGIIWAGNMLFDEKVSKPSSMVKDIKASIQEEAPKEETNE